MIKVNFDTKLKDLNADLLPFVQWKAVTLADLEDAPTEVLSKYVFEMARPVMKALITKKRVDISGISTDEWIGLLDECYNSEAYLLSDYVQLPYHVIMTMMETNYYRNRYGQAFARTQKQMPVEMVLKFLSLHYIGELLRTNSNPGLTDFMFTDEGIAIIKEKMDETSNINHRNFLAYITSEEGEKLGIKVKNITISPELLRRVGACDAGYNYCKKILRELGVERITWDDAVLTIRKDKKLQKRDSLKSYIGWIVENKRIHRD